MQGRVQSDWIQNCPLVACAGFSGGKIRGSSGSRRKELEAGVPNHGHQTPCWEERAPRTGLGRQKGQAGNDPYIT